MKIVRCLSGRCSTWPSICARDRRRSGNGRRWNSTPDNRRALVIPEGCAHGFQVLEPDSELLYLHTALYDSSRSRRPLRRSDDWHDWPLAPTDLSDRDLRHPLLDRNFEGIVRMKCRHCHHELEHVFLDLGHAPPSNAYLSASQLRAPEMTFPLRLYVCDNCWLVQTEDYAAADELFSRDYAYFSSTSLSWLQHAADYVENITEVLKLNRDSFVVEIASNDGYLLKNFVAAGVPCLGVEPTSSTADAAEKIGVPVLRKFFGVATATELAEAGKRADLICGNNVYAHVPDINDFTDGLRVALKQGGTINLEFPHLMNLIRLNQFDTVYHEHFSYLSLTAVVRIFAKTGLRIFDLEELPTHGGSLRIYGCYENDPRETQPS